MGHIAHRGNLGPVLLPKEIFRDSRLTGNERLLLCTLFEWTNNETGWCNPGLASIAEASGIAARNIKPLTEGLVAKGWLTFVEGKNNNTNQYTVHIPIPNGQWSYTVITDKKLSKNAWEEKKKGYAEKKADDMLKARQRRNDYWAWGPKELIAEMAEEDKRGQRWIPQQYLDNFEIVRGGDNSEEAREARRDARSNSPKEELQGIEDPYEVGMADEGPNREELEMFQRDLEEM